MTDRGGLVFIFLTVLFTVAGQLMVKWGMTKVGKAPEGSGELLSFILKALFHPGNFLGLTFAVFAAFSWMVALSRCSLGFAYPFSSLAVVLVLALSTWIFGERIILTQWLGVAVVCAGVWMVARGA